MKYGFLLVSIMLLAGCGIGNTQLTKEITPGVTLAEEQIPMNTEQPTQKEMQRALPIHEDLAAQYSSAVLKTNKGDITVAFYGDDSPVTVNNFLNLAQDGFYTGIKFHRVIKDFMIQGGDPNSKSNDRSMHGTGGPEYKFGDEFNAHKLVRGSLAMANSGPNTNGSQFFIVTAKATPHLDMRHTNFGYVTAGMDVVDAIEHVDTDPRDNPIDPVIIESIELIANE